MRMPGPDDYQHRSSNNAPGSGGGSGGGGHVTDILLLLLILGILAVILRIAWPLVGQFWPW